MESAHTVVYTSSLWLAITQTDAMLPGAPQVFYDSCTQLLGGSQCCGYVRALLVEEKVNLNAEYTVPTNTRTRLTFSRTGRGVPVPGRRARGVRYAAAVHYHVPVLSVRRVHRAAQCGALRPVWAHHGSGVNGGGSPAAAAHPGPDGGDGALLRCVTFGFLRLSVPTHTTSSRAQA
jgi:hypothetical protein